MLTLVNFSGNSIAVGLYCVVERECVGMAVCLRASVDITTSLLRKHLLNIVFLSTHSFFHSFTHSLTRSLTQSTHLLIHSCRHSLRLVSTHPLGQFFHSEQTLNIDRLLHDADRPVSLHIALNSQTDSDRLWTVICW